MESLGGYILPEEFQNEMRWIYSQDAICEEHNQNILIEDFGDGQVKYNCKLERHITQKNVKPNEPAEKSCG